MELPNRLSEEEIALQIIHSGGFSVRDVDAGEEPYLYSSGNYGPGYIDIKGRVGWEDVFETLTDQSALRLLDEDVPFDFISGNATGGMIPAYRVKQKLQDWTGRKIPYVYVRNTRKLGGHQEYITGIRDNPLVPAGSRPLIYEELVNFADTTCNSRIVLAESGYHATHAATILEYGNPVADARLKQEGLTLVSAVRLPALIDIAESDQIFTSQAIAGYREFLESPQNWMSRRRIERKQIG